VPQRPQQVWGALQAQVVGQRQVAEPPREQDLRWGQEPTQASATLQQRGEAQMGQGQLQASGQRQLPARERGLEQLPPELLLASEP
jgi:hypothetical protein